MNEDAMFMQMQSAAAHDCIWYASPNDPTHMISFQMVDVVQWKLKHYCWKLKQRRSSSKWVRLDNSIFLIYSNEVFTDSPCDNFPLWQLYWSSHSIKIVVINTSWYQHSLSITSVVSNHPKDSVGKMIFHLDSIDMTVHCHLAAKIDRAPSQVVYIG